MPDKFEDRWARFPREASQQIGASPCDAPSPAAPWLARWPAPSHELIKPCPDLKYVRVRAPKIHVLIRVWGYKQVYKEGYEEGYQGGCKEV